MLDPAGYSALGDIYDAAVNPGRWRRALDSVADALDAKAIALLIRQPGSDTRDKQLLSSAYLNFIRSPWGIYYGLRLMRLQDPDWDFLSQQPAHHPVPDLRIGLDTEKLDRRKDYAMLRKRVGVRRRLGVRLNDDRLWFDAISVAYDASIDEIPIEVQRRALPLLPHLTKAAQIGRTFAALKARYKAVLSALDHVGVGLCIASPEGDVIVENSELRRILDSDDGLALSAGKIRTFDTDTSQEIAMAVSRAGRTVQGRESMAEHLVAVPRRSEGEPYLLDVAPLRDSQASDLGEALEGALITVVDPRHMPILRMDRFTVLYDLTESEAAVCGLVLKGHNLDEIAEIRGTSPVTAKNQVAAILSKTGVRRRSELIRLVLRVLPPV